MKELLLLGVYVEDAVDVAEHYQDRLSMRRVVHRKVTVEDSWTECIVMTGSEQPLWLAIFSGRGPKSDAAQLLCARPNGMHRLVYLTDGYDRDLAWLRKRGLGSEMRATFGAGEVRAVSSSIAELGMEVDFFERPAGETASARLLTGIVDALLEASLHPMAAHSNKTSHELRRSLNGHFHRRAMCHGHHGERRILPPTRRPR